MYKKVTHTIVEEHFSHPMAGELKERLDRKSLKYKLEPVSAEKFKQDINSYLTNLNVKLHNIFKNVESNNEAALADSEKILFEEIDALGNMCKTYYGIEFGERVNQYLRTVALLFIAIAKNLKNKMDIRDWRLRLDAVKFDMANLFYSYNNIWRLPETQAIIGQIFNGWIDHVQAIINRDTTATTTTYESVSNLLSVFGSTMSNGIIQQFPGRFIPQ